MKKRILRSLVTVVVISSLFAMTVAAAPDVDSLQDQLDEAQGQVDTLQSQLTEVMDNINQLEEQLIAKGEEIIKATGDLDAAEEKQAEQQEDMKLRIKYMYEEGNIAALEKIFSSGSISELLNQAEYVQNVHNYDREMLDEYIETKDQVAELKTTLETEMSDLEDMQAEFEAEKENLNSTIASKESEIDDLDGAIQAAAEAAAAEAAARQAEQEAQEAENTSDNQTVQNNNDNTSDSDNTNGGDQNYNPNPTSPSGNGNTSTAQAIVNAAYSYLGVPYVWGGASRSGIDCSGLVMLAHRTVGISLSHYSGSQGAGGTAVSNPQPGDVVCYSGHVGIYIGNGQMIHAPQPGDVVRVAKVYGSPWYRRYW